MYVSQCIQTLLVVQPNEEMNSCVVKRLLYVIKISGWWPYFRISAPRPNPPQYISMILSPQDIIEIHMQSPMPV